jgi:hypothetical protein
MVIRSYYGHQNVAAATRANIAAMRKQRQHEIENTCGGCPEKMRQVHERYDQASGCCSCTMKYLLDFAS